MKEIIAAVALALTIGSSVTGSDNVNIEKSTVGIVATWVDGEYTGSGVIFSETPNDVLILTAKHVVEHAEEECKVMYSEELTAHGTIIYISDNADVAFISVSSDLPETFRCANVDENAYNDLAVGDPITYGASRPFYRNVNPNQTRLILDTITKTHTVTNKWLYDDFCGENIIRAYGSDLKNETGYVMPGMSGGGAYDSEGNLVGMLIACDENDVMSYSIPLPTILKEYKIAQKILEESEEKVNYED